MVINQIKAGALLNYIIIVLNIFVALLYTPFMLNLMGQSEFGLYSLVSSIIAYLTILDLGIGNSIVRYTSKFIHKGQTKEQYDMFGMFLWIYVIIGIISTILGLALYCNTEKIFYSSMSIEEIGKAKTMILILTFNLAFTFPMSIFGSIMTAYERFVFPKVLAIIRIILNSLIMVVLLSIGYKAITMVILQTIFNLMTLSANYLYCKRKLNIKINNTAPQWGVMKEIFIYSFWIFLSIIIDKIYWSTGQFILGAISGTIAVSVFAVAIQLQSMYMQFSISISSVFLPKVTGIVTKGDNKKQISDLFIKTGRVQNIVMITILLGFIVFGKPFITLWVGENYSEAYLMTLLFFVSLYTPLIQNMGLTILQARNKMRFRSLSYIGIALLALFFEIIGSKLWGGIGCAFAISIALILGQGLIMNLYYHKTQGINIILFWKEIARMNLAPIIISLGFIIILAHMEPISSWLSFIISGIIFSIIYIPTLYKFSLNQTEQELVISLLTRLR